MTMESVSSFFNGLEKLLFSLHIFVDFLGHMADFKANCLLEILLVIVQLTSEAKMSRYEIKLQFFLKLEKKPFI